MKENQFNVKQRVGYENHTETGFHIVSVGHAASNLELGTNKLAVFPIEQLGYLDDEINDDITTETVTGTDHFGNSYSVPMNISNGIRAVWLPLGSNRLSPPNVRRGERVLLWQYGDDDEYYWSTIGLDDYLRRLETVIYAFSATKDESVRKLTPDNSYWIEVSTHRKNITLSTTTINEEPYAYKIQLNTKDGALVIADDAGNLFELDSSKNKFTLKNADNQSLVLEGKTLKINANKIEIKGDTSFAGKLTSNKKDISDGHTHTGVERGPNKTGKVS